MKHNYCRSVSTNGWLVGNSVMTECAQVGCNRVLNEWSRPHTHPPQCRCRLQQLPSGWLIHRCVWDKKSAMYTKQHGWKTIAMMIHLSWPHQFECSHDSLSSLKAKQWLRVLKCWVRSDLVRLDGAFVLILAVFTPPVTLSHLSHVCDPPFDASLDPSWRFLVFESSVRALSNRHRWTAAEW